MAFPESDIDNRFTYHPPDTERAAQHERVRGTMLAIAKNLNAILPPGRELALVLTHLEEAMFWANAAIARQGAG
jgi:hypothetical protein